jgi:lipopolysaccharide transport system permease protein
MVVLMNRDETYEGSGGWESSGVSYFTRMWSSRFFWIHLALSDLRARWRRSYLGALWCVLQPLGMTALIAFVLGRLLKTNVLDYAPYILSGIIFWEFISATALAGAVAFVQNEPYIKQCRQPLAIYTLRTVLANLIVLIFASLGLFVWVLLFLPGNIGWCWLSVPLCIPFLVLIVWPLATALAYLTARYRDIPYALGLGLQAIWFASPVYFKTQFFRDAGLNGLVDYNPIYHLLQTVRAPLLFGEWPTMENYGFCAAFIVLLSVVAFSIGRSFERNVIFYL